MFLPVPAQLGYPVLGALISAESAGMPLPGETALLTAGGLAAGGLGLGAIGAALGAWRHQRAARSNAPAG